IEFCSYKSIVASKGKDGITEYELMHGVAEISDDTQMTLFTANGMLMGLTRGCMRGIGSAPEFYVECGYKDWYDTQMKSYDSSDKDGRYSWLSRIPELYAQRAPGNTCLTAIREMKQGRTPQNNSKGCGGVMRIAPWPLFCACHDIPYTIDEMDMAGGEMARLTHKHPLGWIPAMILTHVIYRIVKDGGLPGMDREQAVGWFTAIVNEALELLPEIRIKNKVSEVTWDEQMPIGMAFPSDVSRQKELITQALTLAKNKEPDIDNIRLLGEGWVAEETLAIAIYAVARHIDSFEQVLIAAVNHDGDSDSTGAVAGNIIGAMVGYDAIPEKFKEHLELHDVILTMADDLHQGCIVSEYADNSSPAQQQWIERYCEMKPAGIET
ncbi:MAG: ADP-ribosylglycohydrolase family protein, partial [Prevotella sp.]|nr:ADP-ribosylglycohydrolase family protein [Prevotella sp.]